MNKLPKAKKHWGQNFFTSPEYLEDLIEPLDLHADDQVIEIGPGHGILTDILLKQVAQVKAFEIDPELYALLSEQYAQESKLTLVHQDFMHSQPEDWFPEAALSQRKLIANIPYHLTSLILMKVLNEKVLKKGLDSQTPLFSDICLMVQAEVADKLSASPGDSAWNALSLSVQFAADVEVMGYLPRELYEPMPNVDSALIRLRPYVESPVQLANPDIFWQLVARSFQMRRKNLRNVLKSMDVPAETLIQIESTMDLRRRGETLSIREMANLANQII